MGISFSTTNERLQKIDAFVQNKMFPDRSTCINAGIDLLVKDIEIGRTVEIMYNISLPLFFFLVTIGLTLFLRSLFFYVISGIMGLYLMVFIFLFYKKYRGIRWQRE